MIRNRKSLATTSLRLATLARPAPITLSLSTRSIYIPSRQPKRTVVTPQTSTLPRSQDSLISSRDRSSVLDSFASELDNTIVKNLQLNRSNYNDSDEISTKSNNSPSALFLRTLQQNRGGSGGRQRRRRRSTLIDRDRAAELDRQIKKVEQFSNNLKHQIRLKDEKELQAKKLEEEQEKYSAETSALALESSDADKVFEFLELPERDADKQLAELKSPSSPESIKEMKTSMFNVHASSIRLPPNVLERISTAVTSIASESHQNWTQVVSAIYNHPDQMNGLTTDEASILIKQIPLAQRAKVLPLIHEMIWDAAIPLNKYIYDNTIAAYADQGNTALVQAFMDQMKADGISPDHYTYGNLVKCMAKNVDLEGAVQVTKEMQALKIPLSLPIYTTLLQTCIRAKDYSQAFDVFDMLKFLGTDMQPDIPVYNSVILAASKQKNINRVFDLYNEMTTRAINPLQPDAQTYSVLIYACARDEKTHIKAWHLLLEMYEKGFTPNRSTLNVMLYLCGKTGELSFARSIFRQMCTEAGSYPDSFSLNCLLDAYANYKSGFLSPVLSTAIGPKLRAAFFFNLDIPATTPAEISPPFLPYAMLSNKLQALAESRAIFNFFKDIQFAASTATADGTLSAPARARKLISPDRNKVVFINERTVLSYLRVPMNLANEPEFRFRWLNDTTSVPAEEDNQKNSLPYKEGSTTVELIEPVDTNSDTRAKQSGTKPERHHKTLRNHYMYALAIEAAIQNKWSYKSVRSIWESRGEWRRSPQSTYWTEMNSTERRNSDFLFAKSMVQYLANDRKLFDAVDIVSSSAKLFRWRKKHLIPIINMAQEIEDEATLRKVKKILSSYYENDE